MKHDSSSFVLHYHSLRSVAGPEDQEANRKRYVGVAKANCFFGLSCDENVRSYLGQDENGDKRKSTLVNAAIRDTLENRRDLFTALNAGVVIVARGANVDDAAKNAKLIRPSIINGAQTMGVLEEFFRDHNADEDFPSVNFELIITDDEQLIGDVSIARNFQNRVTDLSIYGRQGRFEELETAMQKADPKIRLRKRETDFGDDFLDTEKLVQVMTALAPRDIALPSIERNRKTPETMLRVYAYRHRSRCLKDFADVMDNPETWPDAHRFFLDIAPAAWALYQRLKGEQAFSALVCVRADPERSNGSKIVASDGVPDGIVFPMLSALSHFVKKTRNVWRLDVPKTFPWNTLFAQARMHETTTAKNNPQTMGKSADCYVALHGQIEMFLAATGAE